MRTAASHTPARCSKTANPAEAAVTARSSARKVATPTGTGSAAHTNRCSRTARVSRSGRRGRSIRADMTRIVAATTVPIATTGSIGSSGRPRTTRASGIGSESRLATSAVLKSAATAAAMSRSGGASPCARRRPACASSRKRTTMITRTAATAVAGSAAAAAPVARPMTPVTVHTLVAMIAMYARCGGIHTLSRRAANAALTRMKSPEASAIGVPTANAEQQNRRGDARRHREQPAERFAFRRGERLGRLIAPWHEWVQAREERGARGRGKHRAGTDGRWRDHVEGQRRAALTRDEQGGDHEALYTDREVRRDAHRRGCRCDEERRERGHRREDRDRHRRRDQVDRHHDGDEDESDAERKRRE